MENGDSDEYLENKTDDDNYYDDEEDGTSYCQEPLAEGDVEELIAELVEIESKAGEAQEALEDEALLRVEADVRNELAQSLPGNELEKAVVEEMSKYKEEWELVLDELEEESTHLLEQLDGAGIELSSLYRWIEKQVSNGCHTEAWKGRTHWVGAQISEEAAKAVSQAEEYLKIHRPVKRWHGASGFLGKKIVKSNDSVAVNNNTDKDWDAFNKLCSQKTSKEDIAFGKMHWASIYQANTPQQAAELGLKFAGVDEVEEISDVDGSSSDLFLADAIANERDLSLTEEQKRKFRKVKEEDDARDDLKLRIHTKQVRRRKRKKEGELISIDEKIKVDVTVISEDDPEDDNNHKELYNKKCELSAEPHNEKAENNYEDEARASEAEVARDIYSLIEEGSEPEVIMFSSSESDSDSDAKINGKVNFLKKVTPGVVSLSSSDSGSDDENANTSTNRKRKKIRRILDDAELGEETKKKIAIEKERQDRLRSLEATESVMVGKSAGVEVPNNSSSGYIINLMREEDEEAVRIPPSISANLKPHQISGVRFMWENIIQSVKKARSGDRGLGCILAHTMGLGKTFQVIAFLYTVMRCADVGLKTALILTPVSVLHNWKHEFQKWRPSELKPLRVFMLGDAPRENRLELLTKWRNKGGIFLIGYAAFRNLSLGKHTKDPFIAKEISRALQVGPDILVCDEAHIIKNTKADITQALMQVKCQRRIALTGSPLQNNLMEYYCMVDFVREGFLGSCHEFRNRFQNPIENGQHTDATSEDVKIMNQRSHILYEQLKGFVHRMGSSILKNDLPPKTVFVIGVKLSTLQRKLYKGFLDIRGFTNKASVDKASFFAAYHILAQILNHPAILLLMQKSKDQTKVEDVEKCVADESSGDENINVMSGAIQTPHIEQSNDLVCEDWWRDLLPENNCREVDYSGKMVLLLDILTICSNMGDKALVFSQNLSTLDLIEYHLSRMPCPEDNSKNWLKGKDWYRLDGRTESSERQKLVERFNEPLNKRVKCVLISTRAGSLGINLYSANRVIIVDGSWNPTHDLQAIYRAWRFGQTKPVFAYRLMAYSTIEEKIYKRQVNKEGLAARVVDRQQVHRTISKEEMLDLFDFVDDESARVSNKHDAMGSIRASSDEVMQSLISRHQPRWISSYHEHETLLQENEDEKLSKEEQDLAWEVYKNTIKTGAAGFVSPNDHHVILQQQNSADPSALGQKQQQNSADPSALGQKQQQSSIDTNDPPSRTTDSRGTCTKHSHLLMLRSQGTKMGCSTICAECDREISLDDLNC